MLGSRGVLVTDWYLSELIKVMTLVQLVPFYENNIPWKSNSIVILLQKAYMADKMIDIIENVTSDSFQL